MSLILQNTQDSAVESQESNSAKEEKKTKKKPLFLFVSTKSGQKRRRAFRISHWKLCLRSIQREGKLRNVAE